MTGKSHIAMNTATAIIVVDSIFLIDKVSTNDTLISIKDSVVKFFMNPGSMPIYIFLPLAALLYFLGAILPDIDHEYSMLGRYIHLPIEHRTWTHAIWLPIIFAVIGIWYRFMTWLAVGYFLHLFWDMFSASGIQWFYPAKPKAKIKLYHTGKASEYIVDATVLFLMIIYVLLTVNKIFGLVTFSLN